MKIRSDFVTNSSSSSFIVAFKNEEDKSAQKEYMMKYHPEYANQVFEDIERKLIDASAAMEFYKDHSYWVARFEILYQTPEYRNMGYEWRRSKACEKLILKKQKELIDKFKNIVKDHSIFAVISYSDDINSELEHRIMPFVPFVIETISNH